MHSCRFFKFWVPSCVIKDGKERFLLNLGTYVGAGASCLTDTDYGKQVYCSGSRRGPGGRLFGGPRNAQTCAGGVVCGGCDTDGVNRNKRLIAGWIVAQRNWRRFCAGLQWCVRDARPVKPLTPTLSPSGARFETRHGEMTVAGPGMEIRRVDLQRRPDLNISRRILELSAAPAPAL